MNARELNRLIYAPITAEFPALDAALEPAEVATRALEDLAPWFPGAAGLEVEIGKPHIKPGKYARIVYRFSTQRDGNRSTRFVVGVLPAAGLKKSKREKLFSGARLAFPAGEMAVQSFTEDEELPEIETLVSADAALGYFRQHRQQFPLPEGEIHRVDVGRLKYVAGKRLVIQYTAHVGTTRFVTFCKYYHNAGGAQAAQIQQALWRSLQTNRAQLRVPEPYFHDDVRQLTFSEFLEGEPYRELGASLRQRDAWLRVLAAVHAFHATAIPELVATRLGPEECLFKARKDVEDIAEWGVPELRPDLDSVLESLQDQLAGGLPSRETVLHGSLLPSQLLLAPEHVGLVDFDGVAIGDPFYDVAELLLSLIHADWCEGASVDSVQEMWLSGLNDFAAEYGYRPSMQLASSYFLVFFLNKTHQRLKTASPFPEDGLASLSRILRQHAGRP